MEVKLFVSNLADSINQQTLQELFAQVGTVVSIHQMADGDGRQRGRSAHVTMATPDQAQKAIARFGGFSLAGQPLVVRRARQPGAPAAYQSRLSAFGPASKATSGKNQKPRSPGDGYQGGLGAFGKGTDAPIPPRRRRGSQKR